MSSPSPLSPRTQAINDLDHIIEILDQYDLAIGRTGSQFTITTEAPSTICEIIKENLPSRYQQTTEGGKTCFQNRPVTIEMTSNPDSVVLKVLGIGRAVLPPSSPNFAGPRDFMDESLIEERPPSDLLERTPPTLSNSSDTHSKIMQAVRPFEMVEILPPSEGSPYILKSFTEEDLRTASQTLLQALPGKLILSEITSQDGIFQQRINILEKRGVGSLQESPSSADASDPQIKQAVVDIQHILIEMNHVQIEWTGSNCRIGIDPTLIQPTFVANLIRNLFPEKYRQTRELNNTYFQHGSVKIIMTQWPQEITIQVCKDSEQTISPPPLWTRASQSTNDQDLRRILAPFEEIQINAEIIHSQYTLSAFAQESLAPAIESLRSQFGSSLQVFEIPSPGEGIFSYRIHLQVEKPFIREPETQEVLLDPSIDDSYPLVPLIRQKMNIIQSSVQETDSEKHLLLYLLPGQGDRYSIRWGKEKSKSTPVSLEGLCSLLHEERSLTRRFKIELNADQTITLSPKEEPKDIKMQEESPSSLFPIENYRLESFAVSESADPALVLIDQLAKEHHLDLRRSFPSEDKTIYVLSSKLFAPEMLESKVVRIQKSFNPLINASFSLQFFKNAIVLTPKENRVLRASYYDPEKEGFMTIEPMLQLPFGAHLIRSATETHGKKPEAEKPFLSSYYKTEEDRFVFCIASNKTMPISSKDLDKALQAIKKTLDETQSLRSYEISLLSSSPPFYDSIQLRQKTLEKTEPRPPEDVEMEIEEFSQPPNNDDLFAKDVLNLFNRNYGAYFKWNRVTKKFDATDQLRQLSLDEFRQMTAALKGCCNFVARKKGINLPFPVNHENT